MRNLSGLLATLSVGAAFVAVTTRPAHAKCSLIECGTNSPYLSEYSFHELNFEGLPNDEGLMVTGLESPLVWWTQLYPRVEADRLTAVDGHGTIWLSGDMLAGSHLTIIDSAAEPRKFELKIQTVYTGFDLWVDPNGEVLESYKLSWKEAGAPPQDFRALCTLPPPQMIGDGQEWYPDPDGTLLFTGDRYAAETKRVYDTEPRSTRGWVNVACPGGAKYKMFMTRHATFSSDLDPRVRRQAAHGDAEDVRLGRVRRRPVVHQAGHAAALDQREGLGLRHLERVRHRGVLGPRGRAVPQHAPPRRDVHEGDRGRLPPADLREPVPGGARPLARERLRRQPPAGEAAVATVERAGEEPRSRCPRASPPWRSASASRGGRSRRRRRR
jgi:hypothetical protein